MCGRGASSLSAGRCQRVAGGGPGVRVRGQGKFRTKYNLGPQSNVPVVRSCSATGGGAATSGQPYVREVCAMKWGLVPAFAKKPEDFNLFSGGASTFNARVEGVETSGLWKRLLDRRRAVVLLDGFYEWKTLGKSKQPMFIRNRDGYNGHRIPSAPSAPSADGGPEAKPASAAASAAVGDLSPSEAAAAMAVSEEVVSRLQEIFPDVDENTMRVVVSRMGGEEAAASLLAETPAEEAAAAALEASSLAGQAPTQATVTIDAEEDVEGDDTGPNYAPLMLAALYDVWRPNGKEKTSDVGGDEEATEALESVTILTMDPLGTPMEEVHNRMPMFLTPEAAARWLDPNATFAEIVRDTLRTSGEHAKKNLHIYEVSTLVSNMKNDSPDCLLPKKEYDSRQLASGIGRFFQKAAKKTEAPPGEKRKAGTDKAGPQAKMAKLG